MKINWTSHLMSAGLFLIYVAISSFGLYLIKVAGGWKTLSFFIGFIFYCGGAVIWMVILRLMPLSLAFPIAAGSLVICSMLTGAIFLSETVTVWHVTGAVMIIFGISLIASNH